MGDVRPDRCETCCFWCLVEEGFASCRRYPPVIPAMTKQLMGDDPHNACFPLTDPDCWCGEWKSKDERKKS